MTLLFMDGFDHYGDTETFMTDGLYAEVTGGAIITTEQFRTGTRSMRIGGPSSSRQLIRVALPTSKNVVGMGMVVYFNDLPFVNADCGFGFMDAGNGYQCSIWITSTGAIQARNFNHEGTILGTSDPCITADSWNHIEMRVRIHDVHGSIEVRVNGVTVLDLNAVDTKFNASDPDCAQVICRTWDLFNSNYYYIDDFFIWDDQGDYNNDFIGDRRVYTLFPDQDTVISDWVRNTGATDFACINNNPPDDDTTYLEAVNPPSGSPPSGGDVSEFGMENLGDEVSVISAVMLLGRMKKTDAGLADTQMSLVTLGGSPPSPIASEGVQRPMTTVYTYWKDVIEEDAATGAPFTKDGLNAALFRLERMQ